MNAFIRIVRNKRADEVKAGDTIEGRDGVYRAVKVVKSKANPNGSRCIVIGYASRRTTDAYDAYEMVKTQ